jgi:hypothetical protein
MTSYNGVNAHIEGYDMYGNMTAVRDNQYNADIANGSATLNMRPGSRMRICVKAVARDINGLITGVYDNPYDIGVKALAQFLQSNIFDTAETITDVTNTGRSISANSASTAIYINAGTGTTAAAFTDYKLTTTSSTYNSNGSYSQAGTVNAISSNTFTITATITNNSGSTIAYSEVGLSNTAATYQFLLSHDVFTALNVSNNGTLAVTYTLTFT